MSAEGFGRHCIECGESVDTYRCSNYWSYEDDLFDPPHIQICHKEIATKFANIFGFLPWENPTEEMRILIESVIESIEDGAPMDIEAWAERLAKDLSEFND